MAVMSKRSMNALTVIGAIVWGGIGLAWWAGAGPFSPELPDWLEGRRVQREAFEAREVKEAAEKLAACRKDIECLMDEHGIELVSACDVAIQNHAKFDYKWDSLMRPRDRYLARAWHKEGVLYLAGDNVRLQNGFGAFQRYSYQCFITPDGTVKNLILKPGRL